MKQYIKCSILDECWKVGGLTKYLRPVLLSSIESGKARLVWGASVTTGLYDDGPL